MIAAVVPVAVRVDAVFLQVVVRAWSVVAAEPGMVVLHSLTP
jgi:hypothetical protein